MRSTGLLALAILAACQAEPSTPDDEPGSPADVEEALAALPDAAVLDRADDGVPRFVSGRLATLGAAPAADDAVADRQVKAVLAAPLAAFRLRPDELVLRRAHTDAQGNRHLRYRQVVDGLDVVNSELVVHVDAKGVITAINGTARGDLDPALGSRAIDEDRALAIAAADRRLAGLTVLQHRLVYVQPSDGGAIYQAYELLLTSAGGGEGLVRAFVDVDRAVVAEVQDQDAELRSRNVYDAQHNASESNLMGPLRRSEHSSVAADPEVNTLFDNLGTTYDGFASIFGRDSYNNSGGAIDASVHWGSNVCNAEFTWYVHPITLSWGRILVFGDGDGPNCGPAGRALDVVAHEYTHWISYSEVGFNDSGEPNAINEGLSDIFGAVIEAWAAAGKTLPLRLQQRTWTLGEDTKAPAFRDLCAPASLYGGIDKWYAGMGSAEEHAGAGVADLAFCLLSKGGKHPRALTPINVTGIGMLDAAAIFYKAQVDYLVANSNYAQLRTATEQAAAALGFDAQVQRAVSCSWAAVGVGTVSGACGTTDIVWRSTAGDVAVWTMNGAGATGFLPGQAAGYQLVGTGDFSGDGKADLLWRSQSNGALAIWRMNGGVRLGDLYPAVSPTLAWQALAVGDFDGGGLADILWRDPVSGEVAVWFMQGANRIGEAQPSAIQPGLRMDAHWQVAAIGDFNNDRVSDILWRKDDGQMTCWLMKGTAQPVTSLGGTVSTDWVIAGAAHFGSDASSDIVWRQTSTGQVAIWFVQNGNKVGEWYPGAAGSEWQIKGTGDFNADGASDILWRASNGQNAIWLYGAASAAVYPSGAGTEWQILGTGQLD